MDRVWVCGTQDLGPIPSGGIKNKKPAQESERAELFLWFIFKSDCNNFCFSVS